MTNKNKLQIGVYVAGVDLALGPIMVASVGVDSNFFRRYGMLIKSQDERHITLMQKHLTHLNVNHINPEGLKRMPILDLIPNAVIGSLNTFKDFWMHDIKLQLWNSDKEDCEIRLLQQLPLNLRNLNLGRSINIGINNWQFEINNKSKVIQLAATVANHYLTKELQDIRNVYGDFGTGQVTDQKTMDFLENNKDCPHIRRLV